MNINLPTERPSAIEIEKKLLSAMMLKNGAIIPNIMPLVNEEDFFRPEHKIIFRALVNVYSNGTPPDILLLEQELRRMGELNRVNHSYLFSLIDAEYTTARAETYANTIREKASLRRFIDTSEVLLEKAFNQDTASEDLRSELEHLISGLEKVEVSELEKAESISEKVCERAMVLSKQKDWTGVPTGLIALNSVTNGLQKSDLILLAARPSMGKTALALNIAYNAAKSGNIVAVFSMEMSKLQLVTRLLSMVSGINSRQILSGDLNEDDFCQLFLGHEVLSRATLYMDDTSGLTVAELKARARRLKHEQGLDLIVVDYLQLMRGVSSNRSWQNRVQEISEISRGLKSLAKELDVPVLALSQLSRNVEMRAEKKPQLSDLRDSGSLEQDADIVMFLYRDEYYNRDDQSNQNIAELIIAKNRNGPTASVRLYFQKETTQFRDLTRADVENVA